MLVRSSRRLMPFIVPFVLFCFVGFQYYDLNWSVPATIHERLQESGFQGFMPATQDPIAEAISRLGSPEEAVKKQNQENSAAKSTAAAALTAEVVDDEEEWENPTDAIWRGGPSEHAGKILTQNLPPFHPEEKHHEIFSQSMPSRKFFPIEFGKHKAINPNIIPHPRLNETWIIVAQLKDKKKHKSTWCAELICNAKFSGDKLACIDPPFILPIGATYGDKCEGELDFLKLNIGPHDARVFYGPENPYAIYGSNSIHTCFGQFAIDFRLLVGDWPFELFSGNEFRFPTDLQRPQPYQVVEKNWFLFWDRDSNVYVHYDVGPKRSFAKLGWDGSVGDDLAPLTAINDEKCMQEFFPPVADKLESIHQATNSLSITMCPRADPTCVPSADNTFLFTIFQHKAYYQFHSVYEPYVMMFQQTAPFAIHAVSKKPMWISGRGGPGKGTMPKKMLEVERKTWWQTEMFYVTSMSWKQQGMKYHGHVDDVLFLAFGIEDSKTGGIDILAGDLLGDMGLCALI